MDTSEQYIKMCKKAEEIQDIMGEVWIPFGQDILYSYEDVFAKKLTDNGNRWHCIWLPRQDQLQEMYLNSMPDGTYTKIFTLVEAFYGHFEQYGYPSYAFSMEQLWLAFVMKEKYGKIWDGEDWVLQRQEVKAE